MAAHVLVVEDDPTMAEVLLAFLAAQRAQTSSKDELLRRVWRRGGLAIVRRLQEKLEQDPADPQVVNDAADEAAGTATAHRVRLAVDLTRDDRLVGHRSDDGRIQVAVAAACGGIPQDYLRRVFDTGWCGSPSRGGDDGGAGLGLAIAPGVVHSHVGEIEVRNVAGGCRFEVELPSSPPVETPR